jgi:serine phosphatase RsbU (regulator of sigma subunit)
VFAVWHPTSRTLAWINCGHPPPMLIDSDGAVTTLAGDGTYPLGLFRRRRAFRRTERGLEPGQSILLYSDGVSERRDSARNQFGIENISRTLRACAHTTVAETVRALQDAVLEFSSRPLRDDATILLVGTDRDG